MKVLIACECSQTVCTEFRRLGVEAYSCDIENEYGGHPEWHIKRDIREIMHGDCAFFTQDGNHHYVFRWDCVIAHPPCTYLSNVQAPLYNEKRFGKDRVEARKAMRDKAIAFFMQFTKLGVPTLIENPPGIMSKFYRKADQIVQPYHFGDPYTKRTCFWLFGLPALEKTNIVDPLPSHKFPNRNSLGAWFYETSKYNHKERARIRSKTFLGIAHAIATQYTAFLRRKSDEENLH